MKDPKHILMLIVAGAIILVTFFVIAVTLFKTMDDFQQKAAIHVLGIAEGAFVSLVGYYFGSSQGSKDKDVVKTGEK